MHSGLWRLQHYHYPSQKFIGVDMAKPNSEKTAMLEFHVSHEKICVDLFDEMRPITQEEWIKLVTRK